MKTFWTLAALTLLVLPIAAVAQEGEEAAASSLDLGHMLCKHQGPTATGETGLFTLRSGYTLCKGQWAFSSYYNAWARRMDGIPGRDPLWNDWDYDQEQLSLAIAYGLSDKVEIAVSVPYTWLDASGFGGVDPVTGNDLLQGGVINGRQFIGNVDGSGLGDVRVAAKFQLAERENYGMILNAFVDLPTGDDDEGISTGELGYGLGLGWSRGAWIFNLGYSDPGDPDFGDTSGQVDLGIGHAKSISDRFEWITELVGAIKTDGDDTRDQADITTGGRYHFGDGDWAFNFGVRVDLSDDDIWDNYNPVGGLIGLTWSPKRSWMLTSEVAGDCGGSISTSPEGAACGGPGSSQACGKEVSLSATPESDCCEFDSWSGDCSGTDPSTGVLMDGDKHCVANFRKKGPYTLTVEKKVSGECSESGTVTSQPGGVDCGSTCSGSFECGQEVTLTSTAVEGKTEFTGWTGDCSEDGVVMMDGDKSCTANYECIPQEPEQNYIGCPEPEKKDRRQWACDSARESVSFSGGSAVLTEGQQEKLCDLVAQIEHCTEVKACIAGHRAATEHEVLAGYRANALAGLLKHEGVSADRYQVSPACEAPSDTAASADIYLEP